MARYERATEFEAVVVYDAKCPYCSAATKALKRVSGLGAVSWHDDAAQRFLDAQFGEIPFAVFLVVPGENRVYAGRDAARELCRMAGIPELFGQLVEREFDRIERAVGSLSRADRRPDDIDGDYSIAEAAQGLLEELFYEAWTLPTTG